MRLREVREDLLSCVFVKTGFHCCIPKECLAFLHPVMRGMSGIPNRGDFPTEPIRKRRQILFESFQPFTRHFICLRQSFAFRMNLPHLLQPEFEDCQFSACG